MKGKRKSWLLYAALIMMLLLSVILIAYPVVSDWYMERVSSTVQAEYVENIERTEDEEIQRAFEEAHQYNRSLYAVQSSEQTELQEYRDILNLTGNGLMGYVEIPVIDVSLPIYHTVDESVLQIGAGHMEGTSLPIGGDNTHAVISAHSGMSGARMFSDLNKVKTNDMIFIQVLGKKLAYEVTESEVVLPSDIEKVRIERDKDMITLVTCVPYGVNTHRLLVHAERVELTEKEIVEEETEVEVAESTWMENYVEGIAFGFVIAGGFLFAIIVILKIRNKRRG